MVAQSGYAKVSRVDELSVLFSILRGDMGIVGTRPEVPKYVQAYPEEFKAILKNQPDLSDFASIKYRDEEGILANQPDPEHYYLHLILPDKLHLARRYGEEVSFSMNLRIIRDTLKSVMSHRGQALKNLERRKR